MTSPGYGHFILRRGDWSSLTSIPSQAPINSSKASFDRFVWTMKKAATGLTMTQ